MFRHRKIHALSITDNISGVNVSCITSQGHSIVRNFRFSVPEGSPVGASVFAWVFLVARDASVKIVKKTDN